MLFMKQPMPVSAELHLSNDERQAVWGLAKEVLQEDATADIRTLVDQAALAANELPRRIRAAIRSLRIAESSTVLVIRNTPLRNEIIPPTPITAPLRPLQSVDFNDVVHMLFALNIGEPFTFSSIQDGEIMSDVYPRQDHVSSKRSSSSAVPFDLHTDDAFSDYACEYLSLYCLRNPDEIPTLIAPIDGLEIPLEYREVLFKEEFALKPNIAHNLAPGSGRRRAVLFGARENPYLRLNTNYNGVPDGGPPILAEAYAWLAKSLQARIQEVMLRAGDMLVLDNYRCVHGRSVFQARFDGTDRWMRRLYLTGSLRPSRHARIKAEERIIDARIAEGATND